MNQPATVREIVKSAPVTIGENDDLALALQVMRWGEFRHLPVVRGEQLVGVVSERDILTRYSEAGRKAAQRDKSATIMRSPPITIGPDDSLEAASQLMVARHIGCLPVVEKHRLIGLVTRGDLLERHSADETTELPTEVVDKAAGQAAWAGLLVDAVMSRDPVTAFADDGLRTIVERMGRLGIRHAPVVDGERRVIGMLSDRDVRTAIGNPLRGLDARDAIVRIESLRVEHVMSRSPVTLPSGTRLSRAAALFVDHKIGIVPVVDEDERLLGVVSYTDVLRAILGPKRSAS